MSGNVLPLLIVWSGKVQKRLDGGDGEALSRRNLEFHKT